MCFAREQTTSRGSVISTQARSISHTITVLSVHPHPSAAGCNGVVIGTQTMLIIVQDVYALSSLEQGENAHRAATCRALTFADLRPHRSAVHRATTPQRAYTGKHDCQLPLSLEHLPFCPPTITADRLRPLSSSTPGPFCSLAFAPLSLNCPGPSILLTTH